MSNILGWLMCVGVVWLSCVLVSGNIRVFIDASTFISIFPFIYGLTIVVFGLSKAVNSIVGFKYLFLEKPDNDSELSDIYKSQINFSMIAGVILTLISITGLLATLHDIQALVPALTEVILGLVYPVLISGLVYYPLYKKLA
ncbi:hypothetical protein [Pseudoalteromonas denitrificans]|uniref:MotA/TolQ/ExbB proton channel domain-containing protein n=1 Tax=Pseudoalteromonas denitrificans DSM 6059 TaxID=1123010 RepID=A0A1I1STW4_9GAMM|nr:hypothetical protein [Pseudoalteromonas denitrificans]SFD49904.1 hypothetical protein SAMN02745724_04683 [Pseudoalteromonas denitrificans DSM 6059]